MTPQRPSTKPIASGIIVAPLTECHADHIVLGEYALLFLPKGVRCDYRLGTVLEVTYTGQDDRRIVNRIYPVRISP